MPYRLVDPNERPDFVCDWNTFLADTGSPPDTISDSQWLVTPQSGSPQRPDMGDATNVAGITSTYIYNMDEGQTYLVTNRITTAQGRVQDRSFTLLCRTR